MSGKSRRDKLDKEDWLHYVPARPGRVRVNHVSPGCAGGRESMIVERKDDDTANAYCFRCGSSGYHSYTRHFKPPSSHPSGDGASHHGAGRGRATPPPDATDNWHAFPREAREWLMRGGVTPVISSKEGFLWSDSVGKLWIPVRQGSRVTTGNKLAGYVERGFNPKTYLTRTDNKEEFFGYYLTDNVINNTKVVIVEDVISALKVSQVVDCIAITGVHPKTAAISCILQGGYKEAYIFLDADNPTVRMKAREIPKRLPFVTCKVIETGKDPKYHTIPEIEELIK